MSLVAATSSCGNAAPRDTSATPARPIDPFRRNVQVVYLDTVDNRLNGSPAPDPAVRALLRGELRTLRVQIVAATSSVTDRASRLHLEDAS